MPQWLCSSCRSGFCKISSALLHGRQPVVGRVDSSQVVVIDVAINHGLHLFHRHFRRVHFVELLFLQRREKALHPRVVVAPASPAHALYRAVFFEGFAEHRACVLASTVAVQDHAVRSRLLAGVFEGFAA